MLRTFIVLALLAGSTSASAASKRVAFAAGGEFTAYPSPNGHGFGLVRVDVHGVLGSRHFVIDYNSDTLRLQLDGLRAGPVEFGVNVSGEALLAGILIDYYRYGENDTKRGFFASYVTAGAFAKLLAPPDYFEFAVTARKWFFNRWPLGDDRLRLPDEAWVGEFRLRYTHWAIDSERSLYEAHRLTPRVRGVGFGLEAGVDQRSSAAAWGARDPAFTPTDLRNEPSMTIYSVRQWLRAGIKAHARVRFQLDEQAGWMHGADDLVRTRVGGMNPYVVPIAGAPWNAYLVGDYVALHASIHIRVKQDHELGAMVDGALLEDIDRTGGTRRPALVMGVGAFADLRFGKWQLDLRAGWSPTLQRDNAIGGYSLFVSIGRGG